MLTNEQIIAEADLLVPSSVQLSDKIVALNGINQDFFNVVKIPRLHRFTGTAGTSDYVLLNTIREKNIDRVEVGLLEYRNLLRDDVNPTQNNFSFDDDTFTLTLTPAPYQTGLNGKVRYFRVATTTFTTGGVAAQSPDAPEEYHWTYVPALAAFLAASQDDAARMANFEGQYKAAWNVAAQNYQKG